MRRLAQGTAAAVLALCCASGASAAGTQLQNGTWLDGFAGRTLVAIDGSSVALAPSEGGMTREIVSPNGSVQKTTYTFVNDALGTIADARDTGAVIGFFRDSKDRLEAEFADGHSETLAANAQGGLSMTVRTPGGDTLCMAWYPRGHVFGEAERRAALAEYAKRLGVSLPAAKTAGDAENSACMPRMPSRETSNSALPVFGPRPENAAPTRAVAHASAASAASLAAAAPQAVMVRASDIHAIDADPDAAGPVTKQASLAGDTTLAQPGASACLGVESDGHHWGFRNSCDYAVQFSYCLKDGGNPLTACESGTVPGSVASKGFAALLADNTLAETDAEHNFRWVACKGGAGEVVPQLERTSPPSGRCIRASAS